MIVDVRHRKKYRKKVKFSFITAAKIARKKKKECISVLRNTFL